MRCLASATHGKIAHTNYRQGIALGFEPLPIVKSITKLGTYAKYYRHRYQTAINLYVISFCQLPTPLPLACTSPIL